jgi:AraC family transcriptional regulator, transcriptional activator of pobA
MDVSCHFWCYPHMSGPIPSFGLYGTPDAPAQMHGERLRDRAGPDGWRIPPHRHPGVHQVFLILSGGAWISVDGRGHDLSLPALVFLPPFVVHGFRFDAGTEGHVLTLPPGLVPELLDPARAPALGLDRWGTHAAPPDAEPLFESVLAEMTRQDALTAPVLRGLALQILSLTARALSAGRPAPEPGRYDRHMAGFEDLLRRHLRDGWTVGAYAAALGVTATHLTRVTTALAGQPPGRLIESRRLAEARRLLAYTAMGVAEVGYALGYEDPAYFSRAFRRATGMAPGLFRRRAAGTDLPEAATPALDVAAPRPAGGSARAALG